MTTTTRSEPDALNGQDDLRAAKEDLSAGQQHLAATAKEIAGDVADRASTAAARLPDAANAAGTQIGNANELIRQQSDEALAIGTSVSLGFALGLLLGGANRVLVILSLIPAAAMGFALLDRHGGGRAARRS